MSILMKKGFLLNSNNMGGGAKGNLGPLQDDRIDRSNIGYGSRDRAARDTEAEWTSLPEPTPQLQENNDGNDRSSMQEKSENTSEIIDKGIYNVPILPFKTSTVPMAALGAFYGQHARKIQVKKENYHTWNDGNAKTHLLKWTCAFVCPLTGEIFMTGAWGKHSPTPSGDGLCWLKKKNQAEHGAAARAYDCFALRGREKILLDELEASQSQAAAAPHPGDMPSRPPPPAATIGNETAYLEDKAVFTLLDAVPSTIRARVERQQEAIRREAELALATQASSHVTEEEQAWHRHPEKDLHTIIAMESSPEKRKDRQEQI